MNYRTIARQARFGTTHPTPIASGDLVTGSVPAAQLAATEVLSSTGALTLQTGITPRERGFPPFHQTILQFKDQVMTITDALQYVGLQVYTFPQSYIYLLKCTAKFTFTTTSILANTLNQSVTGAWSMGTVTASSTTLNSTMADFIATTAWTSSATINVANTATTATLATSVHFDGSATAKSLFLNLAIAGATDIDADATVAVNGTAYITWIDELGVTQTFTP